MIPKHTFQSIILKLEQFWAEKGCLIWQPYYTQVGAGTMNPATFLRSLGPEPWKVAYVEPSVRPDDGRYGENPNRFHLFYQYQVILKPDPGNPQELYLDSLKAVGIDPRQHDIRFVEDNWEQPAISAWGLGWEVWLDGQEITQFTYFQQVGGLTLDPVAVELTYGLERILIALNNAPAIWDEEWAPGVTYGEVRRHEEYEHSKYYFETADVERTRQLYEIFLAEAEACLDQGLVVPAHDYVLKSSHTFNVLDCRGAIGVTERQACFRQMRGLARRVAEAYLAQRKELEYPLLKEAAGQQGSASAKREVPIVQAVAPLLLEIGVEEMPAADVDVAIAQLRESVPALLDELRLAHGLVTVYGTPRRLAVTVSDLAPTQPDREELVKGPPAERAYDADGKPTQAAEGFARGKGVDISALEVRQVDGGEYVTARVREQGRPTPEILAEALPRVVAGIKFERSMRWLPGDPVAFSRPIRWLVALLGEAVIPFAYAGLTAGRTTRGLRPYDSPAIEIPAADRYAGLLQAAGIVLDVAERQALIADQVGAAAASLGGEALIEDALLAEVANLVEKPTPVVGGFNPNFLALPREVLISVMKKHQRYFPVEKKGKLLPNFIAVRNGDDQNLAIVRDGNAHVLGARFADADFFVREDVKHKLEDFRPQLSTLIFQTRLGSMLDKAARIEKLAPDLIATLGLEADEASFARRAAHLAKADLTTQMVTEMTSLQGVIGGEYARRSGEAPAVAEALAEQYKPVPRTKPGLVIALADRLDSLVGLFAAGLAPSGAKDPFALRRAAIGVVQPLIEHDLDFDLRAALARAAALQPIDAGPETQASVLEFIAGRLSVLLKETYRYDVVDAVLAAQSEDPAGARRAVAQLQTWVERKDWNAILPGYARCVRILRAAQLEGHGPWAADEDKLVDEAEKALLAAIRKTIHRQPSTVDELLETVVKLIPAIDRFFDEVLVMAEEEALRLNRLALVGQIAALSGRIADLSKLEGF
ncbi:MAG: glycine--tRNA ligase subunit beta [Anaerolineales bacterium]|nr:glycine--tRNA ligase subunit beta [Anaerolineales bacterium]